MRRAQAGEPDAFDALYRRYAVPLRRWASGRLPRHARSMVDTEDLVQEVLAQTLQRIGGFDPRHPGALQAYLRRGVLNAIHDELRRSRRAPAAVSLPSAPVPRATTPSPLEEAIGSELLARYDAALARLRESDRQAIVARVELQLSWKEVAAELGKPSVDAAQMALARALCRLAREMAHE